MRLEDRWRALFGAGLIAHPAVTDQVRVVSVRVDVECGDAIRVAELGRALPQPLVGRILGSDLVVAIDAFEHCVQVFVERRGVDVELQAAGHPVVAPPNPLRSLAFDAAAIAALVGAIDGPVVFVGHSYGVGATCSYRYASGVLQHARLSSARAVSNALSAMIRESLGPAAASELDTDMTSFALVSGVMELIAGWLRGDFDPTANTSLTCSQDYC